MVFPTTYPAKAICLAKEVKMSLRTKLPQSSSVTRKHAPVPAKIPTRDCCQARPLTRRLTAEHGSADPEQEGRMFENRRLELLFNLLLRNVCGLKGKRFTPKLQLIHELNKRVALRQHSLEVAHYWLSWRSDGCTDRRTSGISSFPIHSFMRSSRLAHCDKGVHFGDEKTH